MTKPKYRNRYRLTRGKHLRWNPKLRKHVRHVPGDEMVNLTPEEIASLGDRIEPVGLVWPSGEAPAPPRPAPAPAQEPAQEPEDTPEVPEVLSPEDVDEEPVLEAEEGEEPTGLEGTPDWDAIVADGTVSDLRVRIRSMDHAADVEAIRAAEERGSRRASVIKIAKQRLSALA